MNVLNSSQPFGGTMFPVTSSPLGFGGTIEQDRQQRDLAAVRERLDDLADSQRQISDVLESANTTMDAGLS